MNKLITPLLVIAFGLSLIFVARLLFGGNEDTWICSNGEWVKHGNPKSSMPQTGCGDEDWQKQTFDEVGLSFQIPADTTFRREIANDTGTIRVASFYVEKGPSDNLTYQLYAVYQPQENATEKDIEKVKTGMDPNTVREISIDGYKGIEGLTVISGPKTHYSTVIIKNDKLFTVSTWPPLPENKTLTDQILATFKFK
ncbi:MAG: hypothetical protein M1524_03700 [Patescibacteria group bacterium]|nr:hypothetical protein [Patescibacteria group bacterium]